ncbi:MAG TPA: pyridoxal phosphate-dependent aminotransferase [Planctomycetota bacterium]|jgi:aspartate/methionine/tyrosine aminotransferase|nr:pyridoxal phosphate-dependent aminotransferase [Planctomycetota bacterium]
MESSQSSSSPFREIPYMGVIWVVAEAMKRGFTNGHPDWCNLGQGQPEVGPMEGAPPRISSIDLEPLDHAYGHLGGTDDFRDVVAAHYNRLFRRGKKSQYTRDHVSVASGGRLVLSRIFSALRPMNIGYQIPDYTAYEDLFDLHEGRLHPVRVPSTLDEAYLIPADRLAKVAAEEKLGAFLLSNPCNPTGRVIRGHALADYVKVAREQNFLLLLDEFYSHFIYDGPGQPGSGPISGAEYVEDVDVDPVLFIDGLTKSFRYPGWRVGWVVGPKRFIDTLGRAASATDGGPPRVTQRGGMKVLEPARADQETNALRQVFCRKRDLMMASLSKMGVRFPAGSDSTFYLWGDLSGLPEPLRDADEFFRRAIERKVMTVPGRFFDVNPGKNRKGPSPFQSFMRFSFGPPEDNVRLGLSRLEEMVAEARRG